MKEIKFRDLKAEEIECRVGNTKRQNPKLPKGDNNPVVGFQVLLYKNARVDANILDETVGQFNWTKEYYQVKNTMFCKVGININYDDETKPQVFVYKADAGDDDFQTEQIKGEASDSFKRAMFAWGLGRLNLYYAPFIWIKCENGIDEFTKLYVSDIDYEKHIITKLVLKDRVNDNVVFTYPRGLKVSQTSQKGQENTTTPPKATFTPDELNKQHEENLALIGRFAGKLDNDKYVLFFNWLEEKYGTRDYKTLSVEQAQKVINTWKMK